jgi:hypothetical protein
MSKESLSPSKTGGTGGRWRAPSAGTEPVKGNPADPEKKPKPKVVRSTGPELDIVRFNLDEAVETKDYYRHPENSRRKIPQIVVNFPQEMVVTIYGSHLESESDLQISHLVHKSKPLGLLPQDNSLVASFAVKKLFRANTGMNWRHFALINMVQGNSCWSVVLGRNQRFKGAARSKIFQRAKDADTERLVETAKHIILDGPENFEKTSILHGGLFDVLIPALYKGHYNTVKAAFELARKQIKEFELREKLLQKADQQADHFGKEFGGLFDDENNEKFYPSSSIEVKNAILAAVVKFGAIPNREQVRQCFDELREGPTRKTKEQKNPADFDRQLEQFGFSWI